MSIKKHFTQVQEEFIQHIRQPEAHATPIGIEDRRMKIYRELFFNNVVGFLNNSFPVLKSLYQDDDWLTLARSFFAQHDCRSPYFVDISKEFVEFLSNEYELTETDPAFMLELAHYEWVELDVSIAQETSANRYWDGQTEFSTVGLNNSAWILSYQYPVHQISQDFQPQQPTAEPTYLVVYRDRQDEVQFVVINPMTAHLLTLVENAEQMSLSELQLQMRQVLPQVEEVQLQQAVVSVVQQMLEQEILVVAA